MLQIDCPPTPDGFYEHLGIYHALWQTIDILLDFSLSNYKQLGFAEALDITKGGMVGSKLSELRSFVKGDDMTTKAELLESISELFNAKRSEITHSYLATSQTQVAFIYSGNKHGAKPCTLVFSGPEFISHVASFAETAHKFQNALPVNSRKLSDFEKFVTENAALRS
jgi:hypothetical protein